jgi:hypothetical protein
MVQVLIGVVAVLLVVVLVLVDAVRRVQNRQRRTTTAILASIGQIKKELRGDQIVLASASVDSLYKLVKATYPEVPDPNVATPSREPATAGR